MVCPQTSRPFIPCSGPARVRWLRPGRLNSWSDALFTTAMGDLLAVRGVLPLPMLNQKIEHGAVKCLRLFNITQVPRIFNDREASAVDASRQLTRHRGGRQRILITDDNMGWNGDGFEFELSPVIHRTGNRLEVGMLVQH